MKIVALLPFKNEEKYIMTCAISLCGVVDEIVAIDDFSTDNGRKILERVCLQYNTPVHIYDGIEDKKDRPVEKLRTRLLELGREHGGSHFVCLDADEAFTMPFYTKAKKVISGLEPGQKLQMQWLAMWKSVDHYRDDNSVWSNNFKDFIVCDDGKIEADVGEIHKGRTPGPNTEDTLLKLNPKYGAVFHWQFSDWQNFQLKQAWYRCFERTLGRDAGSINGTYAITMDDPGARVSACPPEWLLPESMRPVHAANPDPSWHLEAITKLFDKHGVKMFDKLDIWHIPALKDLRQ